MAAQMTKAGGVSFTLRRQNLSMEILTFSILGGGRWIHFTLNCGEMLEIFQDDYWKKK